MMNERANANEKARKEEREFKLPSLYRHANAVSTGWGMLKCVNDEDLSE